MTKLEYEAYTSLALKTIEGLLAQAHTSAPFSPTLSRSENADPAAHADENRITRCYIAHRLGEVPVGETSILIAVSSPHRKEAFVVAEWLLEEVKKNVAIWKREFYSSGENVVAADGQGADSISKPNRNASDWSWKANFSVPDQLNSSTSS